VQGDRRHPDRTDDHLPGLVLTSGPVKVELVVSPDPDHDLLSVAITNRSDRPLEVYEHSLPWVGWLSMLLTAVKTDALGTPIPKDLRIDDPGPGIVVLRPDEPLEGEIGLASRFPEWRAARAERAVILFWGYRLQPVAGMSGVWITGGAVFPKIAEEA
jgi:hypothetical protein